MAAYGSLDYWRDRLGGGNATEERPRPPRGYSWGPGGDARPTGGQQNYSEGAGFSTGRVGAATQPDARAARGSMAGYDYYGPSQQDMGASAQRAEQARQGALGALSGGGGYGQQYLNNAPVQRAASFASGNAQGLSPESLAAIRGAIQRQYAGNQVNNLTAMRNAAQARGFGDSAFSIDQERQLRAQNQQALAAALAGVGIEDEQLRIQREQAAMQAYLQAQGLAAGAQGQAAQVYNSAQYPFFPGSAQVYGGGGQQPMSPWEWMMARRQVGSTSAYQI